ncbi:hypothetical protein X739_24775 [Mesorhizobium sp. LNHC220B00]|nr:hypothetical protein X739_24775 [Mesorhizobium sp. LNHC220B00]ESY91343.1 hypothetical protein X741_24245 [Mesorhizobium sp. LNHC229A00]ESY95918.1 hypothetical protein X738_21360 [Mesorhizobium sp. LNHC209A00]
MIALIGVILLVGIVRKNAIDDRLRARWPRTRNP